MSTRRKTCYGETFHFCFCSKKTQIKISQTFSSILLQADISSCAGEANPPVDLFPDINYNHTQGRLSWVSLVHGLNNQSPLALGQSLQFLRGLNVSGQRVNGEASHRVGETVENRAVSSEVFVLSSHCGQHSAARYATGRYINNKRVLNEEGRIVIHILNVDRHLSSGVMRVCRGGVNGPHLKGIGGGSLSVEWCCCDNATRVLVYDEHALGATAQKVEHLAVGTLVQIYGFHL